MIVGKGGRPPFCRTLLQTRNLADGHVEIGMQAPQHGYSLRHRFPALQDVIVGDDIFGDVRQNPDTGGDQRGEIGEISGLRGKIAKLVITKMWRQPLDSLHHFPRRRWQTAGKRFLQCVQQRVADAAAQVLRWHTLRAQARFERELDALCAKVIEGLRSKTLFYLDMLMTPTPLEWEYLTLPERLSFLYYLVRPFRLAFKHGKGM